MRENHEKTTNRFFTTKKIKIHCGRAIEQAKNNSPDSSRNSRFLRATRAIRLILPRHTPSSTPRHSVRKRNKKLENPSSQLCEVRSILKQKCGSANIFPPLTPRCLSCQTEMNNEATKITRHFRVIAQRRCSKHYCTRSRE